MAVVPHPPVPLHVAQVEVQARSVPEAQGPILATRFQIRQAVSARMTKRQTSTAAKALLRLSSTGNRDLLHFAIQLPTWPPIRCALVLSA